MLQCGFFDSNIIAMIIGCSFGFRVLAVVPYRVIELNTGYRGALKVLPLDQSIIKYVCAPLLKAPSSTFPEHHP